MQNGNYKVDLDLGGREMTIVIVFKNGYELRTKCKSIKTSRDNLTGRITNISYEGITENKPLDINFDEIICIYRVMSDED